MGTTTAQHFRLLELPGEQAKPFLRRAAVRGDHCLAVANWADPRPEASPPHRHPFDQLSFVLEGSMLFEVDGELFEVGAGEVLVIPADAPHTARTTSEEVALSLDIFAPPRPDYLHLVAHQDDPPAGNNDHTDNEVN
jgi:quercetin dioxygenase-like cupin family protein